MGLGLAGPGAWRAVMAVSVQSYACAWSSCQGGGVDVDDVGAGRVNGQGCVGMGARRSHGCGFGWGVRAHGLGVGGRGGLGVPGRHAVPYLPLLE